ncbi:MAG: hypothetical protein ACR2PT_15540 [Endozoicomonas sp.]
MQHPFSITYQDQDYPLYHLFQRNIIFDLGDHGEITAFCRFSNHCYTESLKPSDDRTGKLVLLDHNDNERYFCPLRYEISLLLEEYMRTWPSKHSFHTTHNGHLNYLMVEYRGEGEDIEFIKVAYNLRQDKRRKGAVILFIETMHPYDETEPPNRNSSDRVRFALLLKKAAAGKPLPRPFNKRGGRGRR